MIFRENSQLFNFSLCKLKIQILTKQFWSIAEDIRDNRTSKSAYHFNKDQIFMIIKYFIPLQLQYLISSSQKANEMLYYIGDGFKQLKQQKKHKKQNKLQQRSSINQQQLKQQILKEIYEDIDLQCKQETMKIEAKVKLEYQEESFKLNIEADALRKQKLQNLQKQVRRLKRQNYKLEEQHFKNLQQKYIDKVFGYKVLLHPKIKQIEQNLANTLKQQLRSTTYIEEKQKSMKNMLIRMQAKEQKYQNKRSIIIRDQVQKSCRVQNLKQQNKNMKIQIATMRSEHNIKSNSLQQQIRKTRSKIKLQSEKYLSEPNIDSLKQQLEQLKQIRVKQTNRRILLEACDLIDESKQTSLEEYTFGQQNCSIAISTKPDESRIQQKFPSKRTNVQELTQFIIYEDHDTYYSQDSLDQDQQKPQLWRQVKQLKTIPKIMKEQKFDSDKISNLLRFSMDSSQNYSSLNSENIQNIGNRQVFSQNSPKNKMSRYQSTKYPVRYKLSSQTRKNIIKKLSNFDLKTSSIIY